jgi:hypothetical protein
LLEQKSIMGFVLLVFIVFPVTVILLLIWAITRKKVFGKILGLFWFLLFGFFILISVYGALAADKVLTKTDYYGQYIIDRSYFQGKQSDWQYNSFRFEIKRNDSIYFYVTNKERILNVYKGAISTVNQYGSERLAITMEQPTIHVLKTNPTIYRSAWSFYLVFHSDKYNNMYFRKGTWKPITE